MEENVYNGGFGQALHAMLRQMGANEQAFHSFAVPDVFPPTGTRSELLAHFGLDADSIYDNIMVKIND